jgi:hypothetical protein
MRRTPCFQDLRGNFCSLNIRSLRLAVFVLIVGLSGGAAMGAPIVLSNATTVLLVNGGESNNGLVPFDGYFRYTDVATGEETTW